MTTIARNLQAVLQRIHAAAIANGRRAADVTLLAVSKTFPVSRIQEAQDAGQSAFGESYVQEAVKKITALEGYPIEWHFVGPIQANKTRLIAQHFQWVHGVERDKVKSAIVEGLNRMASRLEIPLLAEGIERREELDTLVALGVGYGQGFSAHHVNAWGRHTADDIGRTWTLTSRA